MGNIGYIKLFRTLRHCWVWNGEKFSKGQAWIDLLLSANHQDEKVPLGSQLIDVKKGSFITSKIKLADRWGWSNTKVDSFLKMLEQDGMVTVKSDTKRTFVTIENWEFYQSADAEKTKQKHSENETETKQKHSENETETKQKHTVNNEKNIKECKRMNNTTSLSEIVNLFNSICVSYPKVTKLSEARKKSISARLKTYSLDEIKKAFELAEESSFMKGDNDRNWTADFDWIMKDTNLPKILECKYSKKGEQKNGADNELIGGYTVAELQEQGFTIEQIEAERRRIQMS